MRASDAVAQALRDFFAVNASGDRGSFEDVVSLDDAVLAVGSSAREWFAGQSEVQAAFGLEGMLIEPGAILAWENGETGLAIARPSFTIPDGPTIRLRFTAVFIRERDGWKLFHLHGSYPVPDEVALSHPEWWDDAPG
jgi:hypothetical protein